MPRRKNGRGLALARVISPTPRLQALRCDDIVEAGAIDAAGSARKVAELGDHSRAAITTRLAAEGCGLEVLAENIDDEAPNITRFIVVAANPAGHLRSTHSGHHVCIPGPQSPGRAV